MNLPVDALVCFNAALYLNAAFCYNLRVKRASVRATLFFDIGGI